MATPEEMFALVKCAGCAADADIICVVRTYLSRTRAEQDQELLERTDPTTTYRVIAVEHIDD